MKKALLPNGTPDVLFGQNGRIATELGTVEEALAIQPNGHIVAGGYGYQSFAVGGYLGTATSGVADLTAAADAVTLFPNPTSGGQFFLKKHPPRAGPLRVSNHRSGRPFDVHRVA